MIEEAIFAALSALFDGRVFPDEAPFDTPRPFLTYTQTGGDALEYVDAAVPDLRHARVQLNLWAASRIEARNLAQQVEDAMRASTAMTARRVAAFSARNEPDLKLYGTEQEFDCWAART